MGIQARLAASAYAVHIMALPERDRYPGSSTLSVIDGCILGALTVDEEHAYRQAHHADVYVIESLSDSRDPSLI